MFEGLYDIDWSSMKHAYGSAEEVPSLLLALRSADAGEREKALSDFYSAVHHQGDVYACTTASLPFLFELAGDLTAPGRAAIVELLVSIGSSAVERCGRYVEPADFVGAAAVVRERAEEFVGFVADADPGVRRAAIPGLGLFLDDAERAGAVLLDRLSAERGIVERLLVVEAMATLALRLPSRSPQAMAWFAELAADPDIDPEIRLAAVVEQARCAPERISEDAVPTAIGLLQEIARATTPTGPWPDAPHPVPPDSAAPMSGAPPQIIAAFEDLDRRQRVHAPTTELLRTFHGLLGARVIQRTALLVEQLRSPDTGSRLDAIRMSAELMGNWRGDHTSLIMLVAENLDTSVQEVSGEAAAVLDACHPIAEPAREALATHIEAQRAAHGVDVWAAPHPHLRRSHQEGVRALARLGDLRAVPGLLTGLDSGIDPWRAVQVAGTLPEAADELVPRLCDHLRRVDLTQPFEMSAGSLLSALAALGDRTALPLITETLEAAVRHEQWNTTCSALQALGAFGPAAAAALGTIRALTAADDAQVRPAAVTALWAVGGDRDEVMPLLHNLLDDDITFRVSDAADVLGRIGPPAAAALPRLRELLTHHYEWVRVHCAAALWKIGGEGEAPVVLDALLQAWAENPATANHVVACLDRMGLAAEPALPQLRTQMALPQRGGRFASIANDEELQRISRTIIGRFI